MIIEIRENEYLAELEGDLIVVRTREHLLFGKWRYKVEELHSYNNALIQAFIPQPELKQSKTIGFKQNSKPTKKKKRDENKSKTN